MNNKAILEELDYYVIGHDEAKKALISMLTRSRLRHYQKYMKMMDDEYLLSPMKVLLIGASGSGKTHLLESLQKIVHFPLVRVDATQMNPAGSTGGIKAETLKRMIVDQATLQCQLHPLEYFSLEGAIDKTVVFLDEADKLGTAFESSGNWNKHVQSNFLTLLDNKTEFAGVSFVLAGAFTSITNEKSTKHSIGFHKNKHVGDDALLDDQLIQGGLIPEVVGRLTHIVELDRFDTAMYSYILKEKLMPKKLMDLAAYGLFDLEIPEEKLEEIATKAANSNQGVRYLQRAIDKHFLELEFDAGNNYTLYNENH